MITSSARAITVDLSAGGFACLLAKAPSMGEEISFSLRLPGTEALAGKVRVADVKPQQGNVRVSFQFSGMTGEDRERVEMFVFDTVLAQIQG
jgi:c-di-GMP-binding flagellar brake protein YcgR